MMILELGLGCLLLFAGRSLFWLSVGTFGFLIGAPCVAWLGLPHGWMQWLVAFALGCAGALLAVSFEWIMVIIGAGFLGGGYLSMNLFDVVMGQALYAWPVFVVGGIVGMCLMAIAFGWTLILISSLLGAGLIIDAFHAAGWARQGLFTGCLVVGIIVQYLSLKGTPSRKRFEGK